MKATIILMTFAMLCGSFGAHAQEGQAQESQQTDHDDIVVIGSGLPPPPGTPAYGSVLVTAEQLRQEPTARLENALTGLSGFQQFRRSDSRSANPSGQGVTLRSLGGNASSRTLVLLDGVPQADPFFGYIPFNALVSDQLGGARITTGGGVSAFGAGAVAGTVELFSADRRQLPLAMGSAFVGSRDTQEGNAIFSPDLGSGFVSLAGQWERSEGFYTAPQDQRSAASVPARYRDWSVNLRGVAPVGDDGELQARMVLFRDDRTLRLAGADSSSDGQDASIRFVSRGRWQVDALAYVQTRNFTNIVISSNSFRPVLDQFDTPATGMGGKLELRPPLGGRHVLRIGGDVRLASGAAKENAISGASGAITARRRAEGEELTAGLFVEDSWTLGDLVLTAGARADRWTITDGRFTERDGDEVIVEDTQFADRKGWEGSYRGGLLWQASEALALRGAAYSGFRLPTLNELYRGFTVFPVRTDANASLRPEKLEGVEAGIDFNPTPDTRLSATLFYNRLENAIANVTIGNNLRQRRNIDAVFASGVELTGKAVFGKVELGASYIFSDVAVRAPGTPLDGLSPAQSPRHMANANLRWSPLAGGGIGARLRYVGTQYEDDLEQELMPDALTVDVHAQWPLSNGIALVARAENIFDDRVVTRQSGNGIDLGAPQSFWLGIRIAR